MMTTYNRVRGHCQVRLSVNIEHHAFILSSNGPHASLLLQFLGPIYPPPAAGLLQSPKIIQGLPIADLIYIHAHAFGR